MAPGDELQPPIRWGRPSGPAGVWAEVRYELKPRPRRGVALLVLVLAVALGWYTVSVGVLGQPWVWPPSAMLVVVAAVALVLVINPMLLNPAFMRFAFEGTSLVVEKLTTTTLDVDHITHLAIYHQKSDDVIHVRGLLRYEDEQSVGRTLELSNEVDWVFGHLDGLRPDCRPSGPSFQRPPWWTRPKVRIRFLSAGWVHLLAPLSMLTVPITILLNSGAPTPGALGATLISTGPFCLSGMFLLFVFLDPGERREYGSIEDL